MTCAGGLFLLLASLLVWQLLDRGALLPAAMVATGGLAMGWGFHQLLRGTTTCRRLRLHSGGRVRVFTVDSAHWALLAPCSLRLGSRVLLVLRRHGKPPLRLLLGPGVLSSIDCAALGRWLASAQRGGNGAGGTAVD